MSDVWAGSRDADAAVASKAEVEVTSSVGLLNGTEVPTSAIGHAASATPIRPLGLCRGAVGLIGAALALCVLLTESPGRPLASRFGSRAFRGDIHLAAGNFAVLSDSISSSSQTFAGCDYGYRQPCIGPLNVEGQRRLWLIQAGADTPGKTSAPVTVRECNSVAVPMTGRAYFGDACTPSHAPFYSPQLYANILFSGQAFSYTVDVSAADCGCIVALYLVSMRHNHDEPGSCGSDYYCDANTVCGVACDEYDVMEASKYAFHATAHSRSDRSGLGSGLGGQATGLNVKDYHPGSECIDTDRPFQVEAYFPPGNMMVITLSQHGRDCTPQAFGVRYPGIDASLMRGMTPVISYWSAPDTGWFDGPAYTPDAPSMCATSKPSKCGRVAHFSDFKVGPPRWPIPTLPPAPLPPAWTYQVGGQSNFSGSSGVGDPLHEALRRSHPNCTDPDPVHC
eukprot:CAMPEP_0172833952 /NCGR_PEP_ID=MMETSP1075-20121228/24717_1 /TAXON_ID=2916 /ORGANISM="Ceratium fusus, Strain PA161109" /LENGTH=450 /DNA_ID=CAMNT_0013676783 /DNA_START=101 /DNA_END=1450 /DNA_ORIENTATION=-